METRIVDTGPSEFKCFKCSVLTVMGVLLPTQSQILLCRTAQDLMLLCLLPFVSPEKKMFSKQTFQAECGSSVECVPCAQRFCRECVLVVAGPFPGCSYNCKVIPR